MDLRQEVDALRRHVDAMKGEGPQTSANAGGPQLIAGRVFTKLMDETAAESQWLDKGARLVPVETGQETIELQDFGGKFWTGVDDDLEGDTNIEGRVVPAEREIDIATGHYVFEIATTRKAARRIRAKTGSDLLAVNDIGFKRQLANNIARTLVLGDLTSADGSLNRCDGLHVRAARGEIQVVDLSANVGGVAVATAFDPDIVAFRALDELDEAYQGNCRWYGSKRTWVRYARWLANSGTIERTRDSLAQQALIQQLAPGPGGYPLLSVPQWPATEGPNAAPDAVVAVGLTARARCNAILPDANDYSGRRVRLTYLPNGESEDLVVTRLAGQNIVTSTGALGQVAIDVVAANYDVKVIDETTIMLTDPNNALLVVEDKIRLYRKFDARGEVLSRLVHMDMGSQFLKDEAGVLITGIHLPTIA